MRAPRMTKAGLLIGKMRTKKGATITLTAERGLTGLRIASKPIGSRMIILNDAELTELIELVGRAESPF
jgi:hypothetical protein